LRDAIQKMTAALARAGYVAEAPLATTLALAEHLERPVLIEGEAGVGKTALAAALAKVHDCRLIRLQCYEGLDAATAVYEWNYARQILSIQLQERGQGTLGEREAEIFDRRFLLERPLLQSITQPVAPVLLVDEVDRADAEFEAVLLELLADFQITIPELGTVEARTRPRVVLTSNATRELSDALRRRCLYYHLPYPDRDKELGIVRAHLPGIDAKIAGEIVAFVHALRACDLRKRPGVAETLDWAGALTGFGLASLGDDLDLVRATLGCLLKTDEDGRALGEAELRELLWKAAS